MLHARDNDLGVYESCRTQQLLVLIVLLYAQEVKNILKILGKKNGENTAVTGFVSISAFEDCFPPHKNRAGRPEKGRPARFTQKEEMKNRHRSG